LIEISPKSEFFVTTLDIATSKTLIVKLSTKLSTAFCE